MPCAWRRNVVPRPMAGNSRTSAPATGLSPNVAVLSPSTPRTPRRVGLFPRNTGGPAGQFSPGRTKREIEFCPSLRLWRLCVKSSGLSYRRVHEEHGARAAVGALPVEGAAVLADPLPVPRLPAADLNGRVFVAGGAREVKAEPTWLEDQLLAPAVPAGRAGLAPRSPLALLGDLPHFLQRKRRARTVPPPTTR